MLSPSRHSISLYFSLVNIFIETTSVLFFLLLLGRILVKSSKVPSLSFQISVENTPLLCCLRKLCMQERENKLLLGFAYEKLASHVAALHHTDKQDSNQTTHCPVCPGAPAALYIHLEGRDGLFGSAKCLHNSFPVIDWDFWGPLQNKHWPFSFLFHNLKSLAECWCFCASETPKLGTAFCRSYMCWHHTVQPRSLLKAHAVKSRLQRSIPLSAMLGNVAFPSSDNDSCKFSSSRGCLLCTKCCHYL